MKIDLDALAKDLVGYQPVIKDTGVHRILYFKTHDLMIHVFADGLVSLGTLSTVAYLQEKQWELFDIIRKHIEGATE